MFTPTKQNTEELPGRAVDIFVGVINGSLLLLVGMGFFGVNSGSSIGCKNCHLRKNSW